MFVFNWGNFDFVNYCAQVENDIVRVDDYVGCCRCGELCFDLVLRGLERDVLTLTFDLYVGGVDSGYGYSSDGYPYDYADGECFDDSCIAMTYDDFKSMAEKRFEEYINRDELFIEKAKMPLHVW